MIYIRSLKDLRELMGENSGFSPRVGDRVLFDVSDENGMVMDKAEYAVDKEYLRGVNCGSEFIFQRIWNRGASREKAIEIETLLFGSPTNDRNRIVPMYNAGNMQETYLLIEYVYKMLQRRTMTARDVLIGKMFINDL